jgi:hypothetical protein
LAGPAGVGRRHRQARLPLAAISEPDRDYTFAEFEDRAARLAGALELARVRRLASGGQPRG